MQELVVVRSDKTVSAMQVLKSGKVAVARSYTAKADWRKFDENNGRSRALNRLWEFLKMYRQNRRRTRYETHYGQAGKNLAPGHTLFEIVDREDLHREERAFLNKELRKKQP